MTTQTTGKRLQTKARVARVLSKAKIVNLGPTKLTILGRGNPFTREDGTAVRIFNVLAFRDVDDAKYASEQWKAGAKLEAAGKLEQAHDLYIEALNTLMSFSVLEANATSFEAAYQINGMVELVKTKAGTETVGINNPRPIPVTETGADVAAFFAEEAAEIPATTANAITNPGGKRRRVTA